MKRRKLTVVASVMVLALGVAGAGQAWSEHGFSWALGFFLGWLTVGGGCVIVLLALRPLYERAVKRYPVAIAAVTASVAIPVFGVVLAMLIQSWDISVAQDASVFATLAQLIVTLLIAFAIEASAFQSGGETSPRERRELAMVVGGVAGGAALGLLAALWGLIHSPPGLLCLGIAIAAIALLVFILVSLPVLRILRDQDAVPVE